MGFFNVRVPFQKGPNDTVKRVMGDLKWSLTPDGMQRAEDMDGSGVEMMVMSAMVEKKRPMTTKEIAKDSHLEVEIAHSVLKGLTHDGTVTRSHPGGM